MCNTVTPQLLRIMIFFFLKKKVPIFMDIAMYDR